MADGDNRFERPILGAGGDLAVEGDRPQGGGGAKWHPYSYDEAREYLAPQAQAVREEGKSLPDRLRGARVIVQATLLPNYLAASYHPEALRKDADLVLIGTRPARGTLRQRTKPPKDDMLTKTLLLAATDNSLDRLEHLLEGDAPHELAEELRTLQQLSLPGSDRVIRRRRDEAEGGPDEEVIWESVLHPGVDAQGRLSDRQGELILAKWDALIASLEGEVDHEYRRLVGNLTFVPVRLKRRHLHEVSRFNPLRAMRPMPRMRRLPEGRIRAVSLGTAAPTPPAGGPPADHRMVTFDGGVDASHPLLAPFVAEGDLTTAQRTETYEGHGTLVTSALLYGNIEAGRALEPPPAHVDHFRVVPAPAHVSPEQEPYWVLDQIVATLRKHPDRWRIASLSYGPDEPVDEDKDVDRFTAEIDELVHELDVTFLVAVGNDGLATISTLGDDRIMAPSDGVNVIGVGACDDLQPPPPLRAPYSCVGPGRPGLRVQPLGVSFGGSASLAFVGADVGGGFQAQQGTSFAAPAAARGLATLLAPLPRLSANLGRGFAAHFAQADKKPDLVSVGYGRLRNDYGPLLDCEEGSITVVVQDSILRGETKAYPLPFPASGTLGRVQATWTLSFTSPTDPQDAVEYTRAGLECVFRPNSAARTMSPPPGTSGKAVKVDLRTDGATVQRLAQAGYKVSAPKSRSGAAIRSEHTLRDDGKWETVVRHHTGINAPGLHQPELWITYYERLEGQLVPAQVETSLDFALLMTVASLRTPDLYERVRADSRFTVLAPLVAPVPVPAQT
jgi:hypothetical protein